jgi:NAD(P)-dependent dehydrogenase (short-subunit alcohol dehydrogenase family)
VALPTAGDLAGKVAVVTGGSRGIGRAVAGGLARAGASVVIASRNAEACAVAAAEIQTETGQRAIGARCHVGQWTECDQLVETAYREMGRVDLLVNNAGMSPLYTELATISEEYYDKVQAVNLKGPFRLCALFGARMVADGGGNIVNVSTIGSLRPGSAELVYACAKAGLNALTIGLAEAFAPTVRANAVLPGMVLTDIAKAWPEEQKARVAHVAPLARAGTADDFVGPVLWLASDASSYVTGVLIRVDGGLYRQMS